MKWSEVTSNQHAPYSSWQWIQNVWDIRCTKLPVSKKSWPKSKLTFVGVHRSFEIRTQCEMQASFLFERNEPHGKYAMVRYVARLPSWTCQMQHTHTHIFNCRFRIFFAMACIITDKYIPSNKTSFLKFKINVKTHFIVRIVCAACICCSCFRAMLPDKCTYAC